MDNVDSAGTAKSKSTMSRHNRKPIVLICMLWVCTSYAARIMDTAESKRSADGAERQAVQAADQKGLTSQNRPLANSIQLKWPEEAQQQEVFSLSFPEVPQELPPNYAAQLAALYNNNTVVRLSGAGMKRDVAIPLNGTVIITARDPWSPVRGSSPFGVTVAQPAAGGPTAFSYRQVYYMSATHGLRLASVATGAVPDINNRTAMPPSCGCRNPVS